MIPALVRFWRSDRGLSIFLCLLVVVVFVAPPLLPPSPGGFLAGRAVLAIVLVSGVLALQERGLPWRLLMAAAVGSISIVVASALVAVPQPVIEVAELGSSALLLVVVLGQTFRTGPVTRHRILGAIAGYLLLGLTCAQGYALVETLQPGSFSGALDPPGGRQHHVYFSFVTLTTVGYGDILPLSPYARSLAIFEAVVGPLYIAILLARLVSLAVAPGTSAVEERPDHP